MAALSLPESDYPGLAALSALKDEQRDELVSALTEAPDPTDPNELAAFISKKATSIPPDLITAIANVVISLSYGRVLLDHSVANFAKAVCDAMEESGLEILKLGSARPHFEDSLVKILSIESLGSSIKAKAVLNEYEHVICGSRILTDLRPIFGSGNIESPAGMGIVHTLRIRYHEAMELREFFVAMDSKELRELGETIERAKAKEKSLQAILEKAGINQVEA
jgi:hypothetical protein